jgi:hypothetical protein
MKTDKVILGVLGGLATAGNNGLFALKRKKNKKEN